MSVAVRLQSSFDRANTYPGKRMRPTTQKQASRRAEIEARRYDALQLKIAGYSDREIAGGLELVYPPLITTSRTSWRPWHDGMRSRLRKNTVYLDDQSGYWSEAGLSVNLIKFEPSGSMT